MDGKLKKTIETIKRLAAQNKEFDQAMRDYFGSRADENAPAQNKSIALIAHYLGLDFYLDEGLQTIDYSYISQPEIRGRLESDYREMMRYRMGTRDHRIKFAECCRYAQMQAEMLLNYFYYVKEEQDIAKIKKHIKDFNSKVAFSDKITSLSLIPFSVKLWAFNAEFNLKSYYDLQKINKVRNLVSHRSPVEADQNLIGNYSQKMEAEGYKLNKYGEIDVENNDTSHIKAFNKYIKKSDEYKQYTIEMWLASEPFQIIVPAIGELNDTVKQNLR
jgi:hypothetical protein